MKKSFKIFVFLLISIICVCTGCGHSSSHSRDRKQNIKERLYSRSSRVQDRSETLDMQADYIQEIANGDDYDAMLKCLNKCVKELKQVKDSYFAGKIKDKEAREMAEAIEEKYNPIIESLKNANDEGKLNYSQHKKQMQFASDMAKIYMDIFDYVLSNIDAAFRE